MCSTYPDLPWLGMMDLVDGPHTGTLLVPGATLHYRVAGSGPPLLLIPGADGDADTLQGVQAGLAERYMVITHDRRGLSRSPRHDPTAPVSILAHGEDAARLLAALAGEPAVVFGTSLGGLIALEIAAHHADHARAVLAHEPPDPHLLPPDECALNIRRQLGMAEVYRREGVAAAMKQFAAMVRAQEAAWEPDAPRPGFSRQPKPPALPTSSLATSPQNLPVCAASAPMPRPVRKMSGRRSLPAGRPIRLPK